MREKSFQIPNILYFWKQILPTHPLWQMWLLASGHLLLLFYATKVTNKIEQ